MKMAPKTVEERKELREKKAQDGGLGGLLWIKKGCSGGDTRVEDRGGGVREKKIQRR